MAVPPLTSWDVGVNPTSTILNARIRDAIAFLKNRPHAVLRRITSNQPLSNNTVTPIMWNSEDMDTDGGHSNVTNPSRYTFNTPGVYYVNTVLVWGQSTVGKRSMFFALNGDTSRRYGWNSIFPINASGADMCLNACAHVTAQAGDYIEVWGLQDSGGSLDVKPSNQDPRFEIEWVASL